MIEYLKTLVPLAVRSRILPRFAHPTFSQCGEDRILAFLFSGLKIEKPRYLDVGTSHPRAGNNTYLFYLWGSNGVCVEPNPDLAPLLRANRPNDVILNVGVTPEDAAEQPYYMFSEPTLNTFDADEAAERARSGKYKMIGKRTVPTVPLNQIIREHFPVGLDLLSLDAEGLDLRLLRSLDYVARRPVAICVETVGYSESLAKRKDHEISSLMTDRGYAVFADTFVNTIYLDAEKVGAMAL